MRNFEPSASDVVTSRSSEVGQDDEGASGLQQRRGGGAAAARPPADKAKKPSTKLQAQVVEEDLGELDVDFA